MQFIEKSIQGVFEIIPRQFSDSRGYFFESYSEKVFSEAGIHEKFVQDNQSVSKKHVLRGLHFQKPPYAQAKLVRVISGMALDVIVDVREGSPTYGQHVSCLLSSEKNNMFYVPVGFAHGFLALEDNTVFSYKCSNYYYPSSEGGLKWNDPQLNIDWGVQNPIVSEKDEILPLISEFETPFTILSKVAN